MATALAPRVDNRVKESLFVWEGVDRNNKPVRGETRGVSETVVSTNLRRQGIRISKIKRQSYRGGRRITDKDIAFFTRQLATMLKAGVPLLQSFDIVARSHSNARFSRLLMDIKNKVETGSSLSQAFREHPVQFDALFCNLVGAGESSGMLDAVLDRLATYKEKILAIKGKIKSALFYPISVLVVAIIVMWVIMVFVIPSFKDVFRNFGAELPMATLIVIGISDFVVKWWWLIFLVIAGTVIGVGMTYKRSEAMRYTVDRLMLKLPILGAIVEKATIARWTRTLQTMFA
ncbi:MAG: type II secretion system F family protein, partial [Burkholderiales bacterium]